jgi:phage tail-like protein
MAVGERTDPARGYNFAIRLQESGSGIAVVALTIGVPPQGGFSECSGLEMTMPPEEYREGGRNDTVLKFPSRVSWSNIRLRRGVVVSNDLWDWHYAFVEGRGKRRDGTITLHNDLHEPVRVWRFTRGFPVKWSGPLMNAMQSQVAVEELEIAHEGLKMLSSGAAGIVGGIGQALGLG